MKQLGWKMLLIAGVLHLLNSLSPAGTAAQAREGAAQAWLRISLPELQDLAKELNDTSSKDEAEYAALQQRIAAYFAVEGICRHIYGGSSWDMLDTAQKRLFSHHFGLLLYSAFAEKSADYGHVKTVFETERVKGTKAAVKTQVKGKDKTASIIYYLRLVDGGWRIFDINADGVSLVRGYMVQIRPIAANHGFDRVLQLLTEKNTVFAAPRS